MDIHEYCQKMKDIQDIILKYIDDESQTENINDKLISFLNGEIKANKYIIKATLHLISRISQNHHQQIHFNDKIIQILSNFKNEIKSNYSNFEI